MKNKLKMVKILNKKQKQKKIMKIHKFNKKRCFLKNLLLKGKNRFKDML